MITQSRLKERFSYSPETGEFIHLTSLGGAKKLTIAGSTDTYGYKQLSIGGKKILAHRLAWLYVHGEYPSVEIDHINRIRSDNRISNLRLSSRQGNNQNSTKVRPSNLTGLLGVSPKDGKFQARIGVNGKQLYLGFFNTKEEAHAVYLGAKKSMHPSFAD